MKFKYLSLSTAMVAVLGFGSFALAQDSNSQNVPQIEQRGFGKRRGGNRLSVLSQLNLTEAQKQQIQFILENSKNSVSSEREGLRTLLSQARQGGQLTTDQETRLKELRERVRAAKEQTKSQILAVLTAEQRAQYEALKAERKANRSNFGEGGGRFGRGGFRGFGSLNLTEAQQQQLRALNESVFNNTRAQREELRDLYGQRRNGIQLTAEQQNRVQELRQQLRQANEQLRANLQTVLTPEQRQQLEQRRQEWQQRFQQRRQIQ